MITDVVVPRFRPGARDVRVLSAAPVPEATEQLGKTLAPLMGQIEQSNQLTAMGSGNVRSNVWSVAERTRISYVEDGQRWEE